MGLPLTLQVWESSLEEQPSPVSSWPASGNGLPGGEYSPRPPFSLLRSPSLAFRVLASLSICCSSMDMNAHDLFYHTCRGVLRSYMSDDTRVLPPVTDSQCIFVMLISGIKAIFLIKPYLPAIKRWSTTFSHLHQLQHPSNRLQAIQNVLTIY